MRPLTLLDPSYFWPFFLNFWREWPAQWANKYVLVKIFNFKPTFGVSVTLFLRYGCFDMAYENKAFLTNSVIPRPNGKWPWKVVSNVPNTYLGICTNYQNFHPLIFSGIRVCVGARLNRVNNNYLFSTIFLVVVLKHFLTRVIFPCGRQFRIVWLYCTFPWNLQFTLRINFQKIRGKKKCHTNKVVT